MSRSVRAKKGVSKKRNPELLEFRRCVANAIAERMDVLVDEQMRQMLEHVPEYRAISDPSTLEEIRAAVAGVTASFLACLAEGRGLSKDELALAGTIGSRRFEQGISSESMVAAARVAMKAGWEHIAWAVQTLPDPGYAAETVSMMGRDFVDMMTEVITALGWGHLTVMEGTSRETAVARLYGQLLAYSPDDHTLVRAEEQGLDLNAPMALLLVSAHDENTHQANEALRTLEQIIPKAIEPALDHRPPGHLVLVAPCDAWSSRRESAEAILSALKATAVVVAPVAGVAAFHRDYQMAREMLLLAKKLCGRRLVDADSLLTYWVLEDTANRRDQFLEHTLGAMPKGNEGALLMQVLAASLSGEPQSKEARKLHMSERTFRRHLQRARKFAGLDPYDPDPAHCFRLSIAVHLLD